jgi:hypothetical protein
MSSNIDLFPKAVSGLVKSTSKALSIEREEEGEGGLIAVVEKDVVEDIDEWGVVEDIDEWGTEDLECFKLSTSGLLWSALFKPSNCVEEGPRPVFSCFKPNSFPVDVLRNLTKRTVQGGLSMREIPLILKNEVVCISRTKLGSALCGQK